MSTPKPPVTLCTAMTSKGKPCRLAPITGGTVCRTHGGSAPQVRRKADERIATERAELEAARQVQKWGGRVNINPAQALLELVQDKAHEVAYWQWKVAELDESQRAGVLLSKTEGTDGFIDKQIKQAGPHTFLTMLHKAQDQLAAYAAAAVKAGVDQALVSIAQAQAVRILTVLRNAAVRLGMDLSDEQIADAVHAELESGVRP
ncbi:MAG: hypothetical protein IPM11_01005 [Micropruina sp.]|jgi:hypothetical protein|nr:hypothetical protein [Micropruina sp.]